MQCLFNKYKSKERNGILKKLIDIITKNSLKPE